MNRPRRSLAVRDQAVSAFGGALMRLCDATAARGAALVDAEGETVDYAGCLEPFDIRVVAAEWRLILSVLSEQPQMATDASEIYFRGSKRSFAIVSMQDGYALVVDLPRGSLRISARALTEAVRALSLEAGLAYAPMTRIGRERWTRIDVRMDSPKRRPIAIWLLGGWQPIELLGRFVDNEPGQRAVGYRARLADGTELTLVREPLGIWYAEDAPQAPLVRN